jgi:hypothetical protein
MLLGVLGLFTHAAIGLTGAWFLPVHAIGALRKRIQTIF